MSLISKQSEELRLLSYLELCKIIPTDLNEAIELNAIKNEKLLDETIEFLQKNKKHDAAILLINRFNKILK